MSWTSKTACKMLASSRWREFRHDLQQFLLVSRLGNWHIPSRSDLTRLTQDQQAAGQCLLTPNPVHSPWPQFCIELQYLPLLCLHQVLTDDLSPPVTVKFQASTSCEALFCCCFLQLKGSLYDSWLSLLLTLSEKDQGPLSNDLPLFYNKLV